MKRNTYIVIGLLLLFSIAVTSQSKNSHFYYYKNEKVPLVLNKEYVYMVARSNISSKAQLEFSLDKDMKVTKFGQSNVGQTLHTTNSTARRSSEYWVEVKLSKNIDYATQINRLKNNQAVALIAPYFKNKAEEKIGLSNYFYVKLRNKNDLDLLLKVAKNTKTEIVGQNRFMPLWYTLKCTENSYYNALQAANFFYESGSFLSAEPSFMFDDLLNYADTQKTTTSKIDEVPYLVPNDPLYGNQWGLNNTGQNGGIAGIDINAEDAWDITRGNPNIIVAVIDQGFEMNHPDLQNNVFGQGYDAQTGTIPSVVRGNHGTACAGIIGAVQNNNLGVSGVAPNTRISSISLNFRTTTTIQMLADGVNWAVQNGAAVISNSWSGGTPSTIFDNAINNAFTNGRAGLGTIVVFSSGNNNSATSNYPSNSNWDILNVGAIDRCGIRSGRIDIIPQSCDPWCPTCKPASAFGTTLDVVAPGTNVSTTDRQGVAGYNNSGDYDNGFGGTSAACPIVAGVAALILSVNPNLTVQEVNSIIRRSAQKIRTDLYAYSFNILHLLDGTWNKQIGHGLVDAHAAVLLAQNCETDIIVNQDVPYGTIDNRETNHTIKATNIIFINATAIYHAGNEVLLQPGFHAQSGSTFHAYIEGCSGVFQSKALPEEVNIQNSVTDNPQNDAQTLANQPEEDINDREIVIFPNPFKDIINFKYTVKQTDSPILLKIYNIIGEEVQTLVQEKRSKKGTYHVLFDGTYLPEGIYLYRLKTGDTVKTGKIVLKK